MKSTMKTWLTVTAGLLAGLVTVFGLTTARGGEKVAAPAQGGVLEAMRSLEASTLIDVATVGRALGVDLAREPEQSDEAFTFYIGKPRPGAGTLAGLAAVELRVPSPGSAARGPFLYVTLEPGRGPTQTDVIGAFGRASSVDVPRPNPEKSAVLVYRTPRGQLRFGVGVGAEQRIVSATIDRTE